jgi:hypothetical protein
MAISSTQLRGRIEKVEDRCSGSIAVTTTGCPWVLFQESMEELFGEVDWEVGCIAASTAHQRGETQANAKWIYMGKYIVIRTMEKLARLPLSNTACWDTQQHGVERKQSKATRPIDKTSEIFSYTKGNTAVYVCTITWFEKMIFMATPQGAVGAHLLFARILAP